MNEIKNSETYNKIISLWRGMNKKVKYGIAAGAIILTVILIFSIFGGNSTVVIEENEDLNAMNCKHECKAGYVGYSYGTLYFKADDYTDVYLIESENGNTTETIAAESDIYGRTTVYSYDGKLTGTDSDGDGYIEFTISKYNGDDYDKVCTVKCKDIPPNL